MDVLINFWFVVYICSSKKKTFHCRWRLHHPRILSGLCTYPSSYPYLAVCRHLLVFPHTHTSAMGNEFLTSFYSFFVQGVRPRQPSLPPDCRTILKGSYCMCVLRTSGTLTFFFFGHVDEWALDDISAHLNDTFVCFHRALHVTFMNSVYVQIEVCYTHRNRHISGM